MGRLALWATILGRVDWAGWRTRAYDSKASGTSAPTLAKGHRRRRSSTQLVRKARSLASPGGKLRATGGAFEGSALLGAVDLLDDLYGKMIPTIDQGGIMCYM